MISHAFKLISHLAITSKTAPRIKRLHIMLGGWMHFNVSNVHCGASKTSPVESGDEEDGVAQSVEHWTANLATRVRSPVGEEPSDLICAFLHVQMESNWAGLSVCNCRHTGKWCCTIKAVGNTDHTRQTWIHMQTPLSPLAGCGPVGERTSGKVLNWTVRSLNHAYTTTRIGSF